MINTLISMAESGALPDFLIKKGIAHLCKERLRWAKKMASEALEVHNQDWVKQLKNSPIALVPEKANEQHYEVPPGFFEIVLGRNLKYSCGYWDKAVNNIDASEDRMLEISSKRAELEDGQDILELGCGWGSLTFYMAKKYPKSRIVAVSNSNDQRVFIERKCEAESIANIKVLTCDMNDFDINKTFDRVVSIEMFEHMRNYKKLLNKISKFLNTEGKLFVHIFSHKDMVYPFEDNGPGDWMAREFFSGGLMPSHNLLLNFQEDLIIESIWKASGTHYEKTSYAWLSNMDKNKKQILNIFKETYGPENAQKWFQRWRIFFMSCAVLFGIDNGQEWGVSHYTFRKK